MFNLRSQISPGSFSRLDAAVRDEFETAAAKVRTLTPAAERVEEALETIQRCFSEQTRTRYPEIMGHFLHRAHTFLTSRSPESGAEAQGVAERALTQIKTSEVVGSPLRRGRRSAVQGSPLQSRCADIELAALPREQRILTPYLAGCLKIFIQSDLGSLCTRTEAREYWENRMLAVEQWSPVYRRNELQKGRSAHEVDLEIQEFEQEVRLKINEERAKNESILDKFEPLQPVIERLIQKSIGSVPLETMQKLIWIQSQLGTAQRTGSTSRLLRDFLQQIRQIPAVQSIWQDLVGPLMAHAGSQGFEVGIEAIIAFVQGYYPSKKTTVLEQLSKALSFSGLPQDVREGLFQAAVRLGPKLKKPIYGLLSEGAFNTLGRLDPTTVPSLFGIGLSTPIASPYQAACVLEDTALVVEYTIKNGAQPLSLKALSTIALAAAECSKLQFFSKSKISPFLTLTCLPERELSSFIDQMASSTQPARLIFWRMVSNSEEHFQRVRTLFQEFSSKDGPLESEDLDLYALVQTWTVSELDDLLFCLRKGLIEGKDPVLVGLKTDKQRLSFLRRTYRSSLKSQEMLKWLSDLYGFFIDPATTFPRNYETTVLELLPSLTAEERYAYARRVYTPGSLNSSLFFCILEGTEYFEREISSTPLSEVPMEPLVRFLCSKPFSEIASWLRATIPTVRGLLPRLETLTPVQKRTILLRFPRYESHTPRTPLMEVFGLREEEAQALCRVEETPLEEELSGFHRQLQNNISPLDPYSLLKNMMQQTDDVMAMVIDLLLKARVETLCGGRVFLTWGNVSATSSPCVSQDDISLLARYEGRPMILHPRGLFNDQDFGVSAFSLRERLLAMRESNLEEYKQLRAPDCYSSSRFHSREAQELFFELHRIVGHVVEEYPFLFITSDDFPAPVQDYGLASSIETFQDFLLYMHRHCVAYNREHRGFVYDGDIASHKQAHTFLALLAALRCAGIDQVENVVRVSLTPFLHFQLKSLRCEDVQILPEDNPGITSLSEFAIDYPLHTLSAITPREITPENFVSAAQQIQSLSDEQFEDLRLSCICPPFLSQDLEFATVKQGFEAWKQFWPSKVDISDASRVLITLAEQYIGPISIGTTAIRPNGRYHINTDLNAFVTEDHVPDFLRSQGNFSSALAASFIPIDPYLHDGDCGVNSFLLGLAQTEAERASYLQSGDVLNRDVREFRQDLVEYARKHREILDEKFGSHEITTFIDTYLLRDEGVPLAWSGPEAWWIAAQVYHRRVVLYNSDRVGNVFTLDEHCKIVPSAVFDPVDGVIGGDPVHLAHWDVHYCFLQPRSADQQLSV